MKIVYGIIASIIVGGFLGFNAESLATLGFVKSERSIIIRIFKLLNNVTSFLFLFPIILMLNIFYHLLILAIIILISSQMFDRIDPRVLLYIITTLWLTSLQYTPKIVQKMITKYSNSVSVYLRPFPKMFQLTDFLFKGRFLVVISSTGILLYRSITDILGLPMTIYYYNIDLGIIPYLAIATAISFNSIIDLYKKEFSPQKSIRERVA
ncbi:hypothetical protein [Spirochaeta cellobiosiphila]|uniref:hypothetical protein n=1 Tax=Spirochaeta cellobiosiphila TaxID=504483 RepID=UPI0003F70425|nr:hypothetical protein [Spirochaeta cellobiosiphila]